MKEVLQFVINYTYGIFPRPRPSEEKIKKVKLACHRGWHDNKEIMENSIESFERALQNGVWGIEFDIRWTKDLTPVVHHDADCSRVWKKDIIIKDVTFEQLRKELPGIPSLEEVVSKYGKKLHFFIEIKEEKFPSPNEQRKKLEDILAPLSPIDDFYLICLLVAPLEVFNNFDLKAYLLVATTNSDEMSKLALRHNYGGLTGFWLLLDDDVLSHHREAGQKVGTGFPCTVSVLKREINRDIDWIFTNHPWKLLPFLKTQ